MQLIEEIDILLIFLFSSESKTEHSRYIRSKLIRNYIMSNSISQTLARSKVNLFRVKLDLEPQKKYLLYRNNKL